jgi:effector-binding domain-containing protein
VRPEPGEPAPTHDVSIDEVEARPTAIIRATTTWQEYPRLWPQLSGEVWVCLRAGGVNRGCPNVMLYLDDVPTVEVGVWLKVPCELNGRVVASTLPSGRVARVLHRGPYDRLGEAYEAVHAEVAARRERTTRTHWEIYGPHRDDPAELETELFWLLEPRS